ncbi:MAG: hypothetical protein EB027_06810, partial [Actinobacteria bacterium]|nr:hypothetical protein [Actinomycetota bacterium]
MWANDTTVFGPSELENAAFGQYIAISDDGNVIMGASRGYTQGQAQVSRVLGFPNYPDQTTLLGTVTNGQTVFGSYASGATIVVESVGSQPVLYEVGITPVVAQWRLNQQVQVAPADITDGGSMVFTAANILTGLVTSTPTTTRSIQLPTGAAFDLASEFLVNDSMDWTLITLAAFALTITAN